MDSTQYANEWMRYAGNDYSAAVHLQSHHPVPIEIICYHCQQAGEKALKAVLAYHDDEIPRTHDLGKLLTLCTAYYPDMSQALSSQSKRLTDFATITRYPNEVEVTEEDMTVTLKDAEQILSYIKGLWKDMNKGD